MTPQEAIELVRAHTVAVTQTTLCVNGMRRGSKIAHGKRELRAARNLFAALVGRSPNATELEELRDM